MKENPDFRTCPVRSRGIESPGHELATPALRSRYYRSHRSKGIPRPKPNGGKPEPAITEKIVLIFPRQIARLTLALQGGES